MDPTALTVIAGVSFAAAGAAGWWLLHPRASATANGRAPAPAKSAPPGPPVAGRRAPAGDAANPWALPPELRPFQGRLRALRDRGRFSEPTFVRDCLPVMRKLASHSLYVQTPERLSLLIERTYHALALRQSMLLPPAAAPEDIEPRSHRWTYGVFLTAALAETWTVQPETAAFPAPAEWSDRPAHALITALSPWLGPETLHWLTQDALLVHHLREFLLEPAHENVLRHLVRNGQRAALGERPILRLNGPNPQMAALALAQRRAGVAAADAESDAEAQEATEPGALGDAASASGPAVAAPAPQPAVPAVAAARSAFPAARSASVTATPPPPAPRPPAAVAAAPVPAAPAAVAVPAVEPALPPAVSPIIPAASPAPKEAQVPQPAAAEPAAAAAAAAPAPALRPALEGRPAAELANDFMQWLRDGLSSAALSVNAAQSLVHFSADGMVLITPAIFQQYAQACALPPLALEDAPPQERDKEVVKALCDVGWHLRGPRNMHVLRFQYTQPGGSMVTLKGMVIKSPQRFIDPLPAANPGLSRLM